MEAFVLAPALRVIRRAVQQLNTELEQPHRKAGPVSARGIAPRRAVVDKHRIRQAIAAKRRPQMGLHRLALLIGTRFQTRHETRMIVQDGQRMTPHAADKRDPALEVHLLQMVRSLFLEAAIGSSHRSGVMIDPAVPRQNRMHRGKRRRLDSLPLQASPEFARAPGRMGITDLKHRGFRLRCAARGSLLRPREWFTSSRSPGPIVAEPLVASLRTDPEPPTKLPTARPFLFRKPDELAPLLHDRHLVPWHGLPPSKRLPRHNVPGIRCRLGRMGWTGRHSASPATQQACLAASGHVGRKFDLRSCRRPSRSLC